MDILQNNKPGAKFPQWLSIDYWISTLLLLYVFTMPFVSAFAFTGTISLPIIFAVLLFLLMGLNIIRLGNFPRGFVGLDLMLIFLFLFLVLFSFVSNGWGNSKSFNHTVAYASTFLLFYVAIKYALFNSRDKNLVFKRVLQFISLTTTVSALFVNVEFICENFFDLDLNQYIPRALEGEMFYNPTVLGLFIRARGFATESGHFSFMMELLSPLTIYYMYFSGFCKWFTLPKIFITVCIFFSFVFAASSASFVIFPLAIILSTLIRIKKVSIYVKRRPGKVLTVSAIVVSVIIILNYFLSLSAMIILSVVTKMDSGSSEDRQDKIDFFYDKFSQFDIVKKLTGIGPAGFDILGFDQTKSILSLYYSLTFEVGLLGLALFFFFSFYIIFHVLQVRGKIGFFLTVSIISGVLHYHFIANFWYPWFWFIGVFIIFCAKKLSNG